MRHLAKKRKVQVVMKIKYFKSRADADRQTASDCFLQGFQCSDLQTLSPEKLRADSGVRVELCEGNSALIGDE